jgi:outer membrane protein
MPTPSIRRLLASVFALTFIADNAFADTLEDAMQSAVQSNPALSAARARVDAVRENLPLAWAEVLPQLSVSSGVTRRWADQSGSSPAGGLDEYWTASLNTSTLVFSSGRGGGLRREARAQIGSALASYQDAVEQTLLDVTRAYAGVSAARAIREAQLESLENFQQQLQFVSANIDEGFLTQTDQALSQARLEEARAELLQADLELVQASEAYQRLVGYLPGELVAVEPLQALPERVDAALDIAVERSPAIQSSLFAVDAADAGVDIARSTGRVRISVETSNSLYGPIGAGNEIDESTAGLRLAVPFYSGGANSARTRQQRAIRSAAQHDLDQVRREVQERVTIAWASLNAARATISAAEARLEAASAAQSGMRREQQEGLRSTIDVINQEEELLDARVAFAIAGRDAIVAERELAASIGQLAILSFTQAPVGP